MATENGKLSTAKKLKVIAAQVYDNADYIKGAKSYVKQEDVKGKKVGKTYTVYIPGTGKVFEGLDASEAVSDITEVEYDITMKNKGIFVENDAWENLTSIEDATSLARVNGRKLGGEIVKDVISDTVFQANQVVVASGASLSIVADAAAALTNAAADGSKAIFQDPKANAKMSVGALGQFIPSDIQKEIYSSNYLGEFGGLSVVSTPHMPTVVAGCSGIDIPFVAVSGTGSASATVIGAQEITAVSAVGGKKGECFAVEGLKLVDMNGIQTNQDFTVILQSDATTANIAEVAPIRIGVGDSIYNAPNAYLSTAPSGNLAGTALLTSGATYLVGVARPEDALAFDTYKFDDIPGCENDSVTFKNLLTLQVAKGGQITDRSSVTRLDCPYAAGIPDARTQVTTYIKQ